MTTIAQPKGEIAREAVRLLLEGIKGVDEAGLLRGRVTLLEAYLCLGGSVCAPTGVKVFTA